MLAPCYNRMLTLARQIIMRQELFSQLWLEDQARIRGREAATATGLATIDISAVPTSEWIKAELKSRPNLSQAQVARAAGIQTSDMSNAVSGHRYTSDNVRRKVYEALMTIV